MKTREINLQKFCMFSVTAIFIYIVFDAYMIWMSKNPNMWIVIPAIFIPMLFLDVIGIYAFEWSKKDPLKIVDDSKWARETNANGFKKFAVERKWLAFSILSIWPCPMAGFLYLRKSKELRLKEVLRLNALGSLVCTLFWTVSLEAIWKIAMYAWDYVKNV